MAQYATDNKVTENDVNSSRKERASNFELFRIITMLLIIAHHYVVNSGLTAADGPVYADPCSWRSLFLLVFGAWGKIGINCFVLITGYFMCASRITARKFIKLLAEVMFYRLVIYGIFWITGYKDFKVNEFAMTLIPITFIGTGFTNAFLVFYLCIPFLNVLVHNITEKQHVKLLLLCFFAYVFLGTIPGFSVTMNYLSWFIVLFFIASFIRLHPKKTFENAGLWKLAAFFSVVLSICSVIGCAWLGTRVHKHIAHFFVTDSNAFLAVLTATALFMAVKNMKIKNSKVINAIAASTFGVFLIHTCGDAMREWLWKDMLDNVGHYGKASMPLYAVGSVLAVFIVCTLIDMIRISCFEKPFLKIWDKCWDGIQNKYRRLEGKLFSEPDAHEQDKGA